VKFTVTETVNAPRSEVLDALIDADYYDSLGDGISNLEKPEFLDLSTDGTTSSIRVRYAFAGNISGPARMAVDPTKLTWVIHTDLDLRTHSATFEVIPDHYDGMLSCAGTLTLDEAGATTVETFSGSLDVHLPLISSTAERAILDGFTRHLETEATALAAYCARSREG